MILCNARAMGEIGEKAFEVADRVVGLNHRRIEQLVSRHGSEVIIGE